MDKMREEFEDWYLKQVDDDDVESIDLWDAWKASRTALCVELPMYYNLEQSDYRDWVADALDEHGIGIK